MQLEQKVEEQLTNFLTGKGYDIRVQPLLSTIDIIATKGKNIILFEVKSKERIDASDIANLKSEEEKTRKELKANVKSFLYSQGTITGSAQELSRQFNIGILKPEELGCFYSNPIFNKK